MPFDLLFDGKVIASVNEQVTGVRVQTSRGESSVTGISPNEGAVQIILDRVQPGGPPRLDQIEAKALQELRDSATEGMLVGTAPGWAVMSRAMQGDQGHHDETTRPGGVDLDQRRRGAFGPSRDLAEGLSSQDTEVLTARLNAFGEHGDSDRAVRDNPASGRGFTAETGAGPTASDSVSSADSLTPPFRSRSEGSSQQTPLASGNTTDDEDERARRNAAEITANRWAVEVKARDNEAAHQTSTAEESQISGSGDAAASGPQTDSESEIKGIKVPGAEKGSKAK